MLGIGKTGRIEKDIPACGPLDAIVKPMAVSPCTSDIHTVWEGAIGERTDMILGHEAVGEIDRNRQPGQDTKARRPGNRARNHAGLGRTRSPGRLLHALRRHAGRLEVLQLQGRRVCRILPCKRCGRQSGAAARQHRPRLDACHAVATWCPPAFTAWSWRTCSSATPCCVIGIGPVGLMSVAGATPAGAPPGCIAVGSRPVCVEAAKALRRHRHHQLHASGDIAEQMLRMTTHGTGRRQGRHRRRRQRHLYPGCADAEARAASIGNVNYLGSGDYVTHPPRRNGAAAWATRPITGGLMPGGRLRMKSWPPYRNGRLSTAPMLTHRFKGFDHMEEALMLMKDKPRDLIKPVVLL